MLQRSRVSGGVLFGLEGQTEVRILEVEGMSQDESDIPIVEDEDEEDDMQSMKDEESDNDKHS
jgi:hypothetical protein